VAPLSDEEVIRYKDISETMRRFLGVFEGLRKMGFLAEQIFCETRRSVSLGGKPAVFAVLRAQNKEFFMEIGELRNEKKLGEEYKRVALALNENRIPQKDMERIWHESICRSRAQEFHTALMLKGFTIPRRTN
jgi:hypothetical protein